MALTSRFTAFPCQQRRSSSSRPLLVVNQAFAVYLESAVAATFGWPLVFLTVVTFIVAALDGIRRLLT